MAIRFDAGTDLLIGPGWAGNVSTVLCWVKIVTDTNASADPFLVYPDAGGGGAIRALLGTDTTGTQMDLYDSTFASLTGPNMTVGTWYCFGAVMNNTSWTLYYGTSPGSLTTVGPSTMTAFTDPGSFSLSHGSEPLDGDIANLKIFTAALSSGQVATELANYAVSASNLLRRHTFKTTSLTPDGGSDTTALTAGSTSVSLATAPPVNDIVALTAGIASGAALGSPTVANGGIAPAGIGTGEAFGSPVVSGPVLPTGIATGEAFGSPVVNTGLTIAVFGIDSVQGVGTPVVHPFPLLVQTAHGFANSGTLTTTLDFTGAPAVAGNAIVFAMAGNRDIGTLSLSGAGWHAAVNTRHDRVSHALWWRVAAGGETGVTATWTSGNDAGSQVWLGEFDSALSGVWALMGSASVNTDGTNQTSIATGTTAALAGDGVAVAGWAVENVLSDSTDSVSAPYVLDYTQGAGVFEAGQWVALADVIAATTTGPTLTRAAPVTASPMAAGVIVLGVAVNQSLSPSGIATGEALGTPVIFQITPVGIATGEAFGTATVFQPLFLPINPVSIDSAEAFGSALLYSGFLVSPSPVLTGEAFGVPALSIPARAVHVGSLTPTLFRVGSALVDAIYTGSVPVWT